MKNGLIIFFLAITISSHGQGDSTNIYYQALKYYNSYLDTYKFEEAEIFIESNNGITDKLPKQIRNRSVTVLTWENQKEVYKRNKNKIRHVKIFPARTNGDLIEINFTPYFGEYKGKKKGYNLAVSNWAIIQFRLDCDTKTFRYLNTRTGGI